MDTACTVNILVMHINPQRDCHKSGNSYPEIESVYHANLLSLNSGDPNSRIFLLLPHFLRHGRSGGSPAANQRFYKLPDFWSASPAAWFGVVEAQFLLRGTEAQRDRFALVSAVLPEASARRVAHILAAPGDTCYTDLKAALLAAHQLTSFQKAEHLFSAEPLGERCPSELLSEMLELVHPGEERTHLFAMLFLRRLPRLSATSSPRTTTRTCSASRESR